jgi:hypothetical protein
MKKITLLIASALTAFGLSAQIADTVSTGAGYANDVYYSLENNEIISVDRANWDIAFSVGGMGSTILTNEGSGTSLYFYPNGDTSAWSTIDTAGIATWTKYYNHDSLWSVGAFSQTATMYKDEVFETYDMGWGLYDYGTTHIVTGDSLFVLKLSDGSFKKLWIDRLQSGHYYFKSADLDGSNEVSDTVVKADYENKNFGYYSLKTGTELDREPDNSTWDLLFTKYNTPVMSQYGFTPYGVTAVLSNDGVSVNKVSGVATEKSDTLSSSFSGSLSAIGGDWKSYSHSSGGYAVSDSLTYFVKSKDSDLWKVVFTGFGGSATGDYHFTKQKIVTSVGTPELNISSVGTYPNPASDLLNIVFDQKNADEVIIEVYNISGVVISSQSIYGNGGLNTLRLDVGNYASGLYMVNVSSQGGSVLSKVLVK